MNEVRGGSGLVAILALEVCVVVVVVVVLCCDGKCQSGDVMEGFKMGVLNF